LPAASVPAATPACRTAVDSPPPTPRAAGAGAYIAPADGTPLANRPSMRLRDERSTALYIASTTSFR